MSLNDELKRLAMEQAEKIFNDIYVSKEDPTKKIDGEAEKVYKELENWGWFNQFPISHEKAHEIFVRIIAMQRYRHLRWQRQHPPRKKPTKWQVVTGNVPKR